MSAVLLLHFIKTHLLWLSILLLYILPLFCLYFNNPLDCLNILGKKCWTICQFLHFFHINRVYNQGKIWRQILLELSIIYNQISKLLHIVKIHYSNYPHHQVKCIFHFHKTFIIEPILSTTFINECCNRFCRCNQTCHCVAMVSVTLLSRYQSRPLMYI